jgi:hypothetical protein
MNAPQAIQADERTLAVARAANTWGLNFITFALLIDIMVRSWFLGEAPWDLFALIVLSGGISTAYMARHKVLGPLFGWKFLMLMVVSAIVAAVVAALLAMSGAM